MKTWKALLYALCISILLVGLRISISWSYTSRIVGLCLVCISLTVLYVSYVRGRKDVVYASQINIKHICLGLLLILIDVSYNLYIGDEFRSLDYGLLGAGSVIILMNSGLLRFLKLDEEMISFSTYFIFIVILSYAFLFSGLPFILNSTENVFFDFVTGISVILSAFFLRFINPNAIATLNTINFDGYKISIGYACSGVESITIFLSAVVAYFVAIKEKDIKKIGLYAIIGLVALFIMNILRIIAIILAGYYLGTEEMLFVHYHLGWVMFTLGMAVFWYLVFR
jgi:exosortase/archaeosortase family protein